MTPIYHITHIRNLPSILEQGGLWCDGEAARQRLCTVAIAHDHIKHRRANRRVPLGPGGSLADYVPFYFAPRSPMLYAICQGAVEGYGGGQENVLHLVSSAERIAQEGLRFAYTEGHAVMAPSEFYDDLKDLGRIDWPLMRSRYWFDTDEDPDRKRRRQAEFLVHRFAPLPCLLEIGVMTEPVAQRVSEILGRDSALGAKVRRNWYY